MKTYLNVLFALILCLLLGVGTFLSAPQANAQGTSRISGRVIDAGTGLGVSGAHVEVILYKSLSGYHIFCGWADTNADGYYTTSGIPTGQYAVRVQAAGYVIQYYQDTHQNEAVPVSVTAPNDTPNINFNLETGNIISGSITDGTTSQPIANLHVYATDYETNEWMAGINTDGNGNYTLVVPTGSYRVIACASCSNLYYADEFYNNIFNWDEALPVAVTTPGGVRNIDFSLEPGGTISGRIIDTNTGLGVSGAQIDLFEYSSLRPGKSWVPYGWATTDTDGYYITTALHAGQYGIRVQATGYKTEWYKDTYMITQAIPLTVDVPIDTPDITFSLDEGEDIPRIGPAPAFGWRFDSSLAIGLIIISPALYFAGRRFRKKGRNIDLTKIVYPIILILAWWNPVSRVYLVLTHATWDPGMSLQANLLFCSFIPIAFSYAAIRKVKLEFKWSTLSVIGMIIVAYFFVVAIGEFLDPAIPKFNYFFTGIYDHTFYPLALGLLILSDLNKMPKIFWLILLPLAVMLQQANINLISMLLSGVYAIPADRTGPSLFFYFGVENMAQLLELPQDRLMSSLILYLREELGYFILMPALPFYYLLKSLWKSLFRLIKRRPQDSPSQI